MRCAFCKEETDIYNLICIKKIPKYEFGLNRKINSLKLKMYLCDDCWSNFIIMFTEQSKRKICPYCERAEALATGKTDDTGIEINYPNTLIAYGYDIHGTSSNGLIVKINYCPMCGKKLQIQKK